MKLPNSDSKARSVSYLIVWLVAALPSFDQYHVWCSGPEDFAAKTCRCVESLLFAGVPPKVLGVHVLVNSQEDLNMNIEYDVPAGVIRFRDFEEALGIQMLKYALSKNDAAPDTIARIPCKR